MGTWFRHSSRGVAGQSGQAVDKVIGGFSMENYMNTALSPEQRAQDLLRRLSLEEKMAQLTCTFPRGKGDLRE